MQAVKNFLRDELNSTIRMFILIVLISIVGFFLLVAAYLLPLNNIVKHVEESIDKLKDETIQFQVIDGYSTTTMDNYTEGLTFNSAICDGGGSVFERAAAVHQYRYADQEMYYYALFKYFDGEDDYFIDEYARDWHGYLAYIKPLLLVLNYDGIRILNLGIQLISCISIIWLLIKKGKGAYIPAFLIMLISIAAPVIFMSMEYSAIFNLILFVVIYILIKGNVVIEKTRLRLVFVIIGVILAYVDVLTFPILTLGVPMVLIYYLYEDTNSKEDLFSFITRCVWYWGLGYGAMWAMKWVVASIFTEKNVLKDAILMVLYRMSSTSAESGEKLSISIGEVYSRNFGVFLKTPYIICAILAVCWVIWCIYKRKYSLKRTDVIFLVTASALPMLWYLVVKNHSYIHYWMTYRNIGTIVFAICCFETKCRINKRNMR